MYKSRFPAWETADDSQPDVSDVDDGVVYQVSIEPSLAS